MVCREVASADIESEVVSADIESEVVSADIESEVRLRWPVWALGASRWNATADVGSDHPLHEPVST